MTSQQATEKTKKEQFRELLEELTTDRPPHQYGWCEECESEVMVDAVPVSGGWL